MKHLREKYWFKWFLLPLIIGIILISLSFLISFAISCENEQKEAYIKNQKLTESENYIKINAIDDALVIIDELLWMVSKQHEAQLYGRLVNDKGICFYILAEKKMEDREINIKKSIQAYNEAFEIRTKEKYPEDYAETMNGLGVSCWLLSSVRDEELNLRESIKYYDEALTIYTPEKYPDKNWEVMRNKTKSEADLKRYE